MFSTATSNPHLENYSSWSNHPRSSQKDDCSVFLLPGESFLSEQTLSLDNYSEHSLDFNEQPARRVDPIFYNYDRSDQFFDLPSDKTLVSESERELTFDAKWSNFLSDLSDTIPDPLTLSKKPRKTKKSVKAADPLFIRTITTKRSKPTPVEIQKRLRNDPLCNINFIEEGRVCRSCGRDDKNKWYKTEGGYNCISCYKKIKVNIAKVAAGKPVKPLLLHATSPEVKLKKIYSVERASSSALQGASILRDFQSQRQTRSTCKALANTLASNSKTEHI